MAGIHNETIVGSGGRGLCAFALSVVLAMAGSGCAKPMYPVTTGFHAPDYPGPQHSPQRIIIWSNHPKVGAVIMEWLQQTGQKVIERSRVQEILNEQKIRLGNRPDDDAHILRAGRLAGADYIIFAYATIGPVTARPIEDDPQFGGFGSSGQAFHVSVSARSVSVATGEIRWSGTASYPNPITNPERALALLTESAFVRATCKTETDFEWNEQSGCIKKP